MKLPIDRFLPKCALSRVKTAEGVLPAKLDPWSSFHDPLNQPIRQNEEWVTMLKTSLLLLKKISRAFADMADTNPNEKGRLHRTALSKSFDLKLSFRLLLLEPVRHYQQLR